MYKIVPYARDNIGTLQRFVNSRIFTTYYAMGYARQEYINNQEEYPTEAEIMEYLQIDVREIHLTRRTYSLFKY